MSPIKQSESFKFNFVLLKFFGIWPGCTTNKYYKYYSIVYFVTMLLIYNILLTVNLFYTPQKVELLIREVIFIFTEVVVTTKVLMILLMREKLVVLFDMLDDDIFNGEDAIGRDIVLKYNSYYKSYWKMFTVLSLFAYFSQVFLPIIIYFIFNVSNPELPICKYYFLSNQVREKYFWIFLLYQSFGMFGHLIYNVNIDTLMSGLILMAVAQLKLLNHNLRNVKFQKNKSKLKVQIQENIQMTRLNQCLKHYDVLLKYFYKVQEFISVTMFIQFGVASAIICVVMCGLLLSSTTETMMFMVSYLFAMTLEIFVPTWLGTQLSYESQELVFAAYNSEWIPRSESFKRSLRLFMEHANAPLTLTGLKLFPLCLGTFISIMKTAYSFFTLVRNVQDSQGEAI
uniref:Odorant receptor n=1 Tax=Eogystia hippophaecolus TaxID=1206364 RepID=A0A1B3P5M6_EOGHI|nr:odorant receptor [Eogystia hippophaecolus]